MTALDRAIPTPRLLEVDTIDLAIPCDRAWEIVRHGDLARSKLVHLLFAVRTLPNRLMGRHENTFSLLIDDLQSSVEHPGFQILVDDAPHEVVVGAIGKVWEPNIPFVHVADAEAFASFSEPGFVKVAWALQVSPRGSDARVAVEVRVDATDEASWQKFRSYFRLIGPGSHFIRHALLSSLAREHGTPQSKENERPLAGDELLPDVLEQVTHGITIAATPGAIWPWLVQMGCKRAGFYSVDLLDNKGVPSAREIHPELQKLSVGDVLPATPGSEDGFEVLRIEQNQALVLGGLFDPETGTQLPFAALRPARYWHVTWSFTLEPLDAKSTRLLVRARAAFPASGGVHASWIRLVHHFMETAQLRHLAERAEGRLPENDWRDVAEGVGGAAIMTAAFLTPFLRSARNHWGLSESAASRSFPGDEIVSQPRWTWTHGIEIDASTERVWPWIAQIGAERAGFYSYQWLENLVGCRLQNAETIHDDWAIEEGGTLRLHPAMPPLRVVTVVPGKWFIAHAGADPSARASGKRWAETTWLFHLEPLDHGRSRFISRFRCNCSDDLASRLSFGPQILEPIGFAMDRRMLKGVKVRAEHAPLQLKRMA